MTATVIIGTIALICSLSVTVLVAVTFRAALRDAFLMHQNDSLRAERHLDTVLDRLMTIRWEDYAVVRSTNDNELDGGFFPPGSEDEEDDAVVVDDGKWGHLSTLRERLRVTTEEQSLIDEDFDETGSPR